MVPEETVNNILDNYRKELNTFDEMMANGGQLRPGWEKMMSNLQSLGIEELKERKKELYRVLEEKGVTYNIYENEGGFNQAWKLDPLPFIIQEDIWDTLEHGLQQRARLLDCLFKDLYQDQRCIREGIIPQELIYADPSFFRACTGMVKGASIPDLLLYAADIARGPKGGIWVISDRTQAPSGWAYTRENRMAMTQVMPDIFQHHSVRKIGGFFRQAHEGLLSFAPQGDENPRVVVLSPGPMNETYFEHAYLAHQQGYVLAQGQDLMVKDEHLYLKTLKGLEKVDIIIRRVDDDYCDPLVLRMDSQLGIPGLVEVARNGNVILANPLGSGILENPGLMAFMPSLSKFYLQEELKLPNIATWWCGQEKERGYVLEHIEQLVIKRVSRQGKRRTMFGWKLTDEEVKNLKADILRQPYMYVGQQQAVLGSSPAFTNDTLLPRHTVIRCFSFADKDQYTIIPGGLSRSAAGAQNAHISNQSGGIGKDTWVLSREHDKSFSPPSNHHQSFQAKRLENLPSRTGENLYWVGRYTSRMLYTSRLLRMIYSYQAELKNYHDTVDQEVYYLLLKCITHLTMTYPGFVGEDAEDKLEHPDKELAALISDPLKIGGLSHSMYQWKEAATVLRDRWPVDSWRLFGLMEEKWKKIAHREHITPSQAFSFLDHIVQNLAAFLGFTQISLSKEEGNPLFRLGYYLESSMMSVSFLRSILVNTQASRIEHALMEASLIYHDSLNSYRYRFPTHLALPQVLELLLRESSHPQSLMFGVQEMEKCLGALPNNGIGQLREDQKAILKISTSLKLAAIDQLLEQEKEVYYRKEFDKLLESIWGSLFLVSNTIVQTYFSHTNFDQQHPLFTDGEDV